MKIIFTEQHLNESNWGNGRSKSFTDNDFVLGPDGTRYDTKFIVSLVNNACLRLEKVTGSNINTYLNALPIVYTFRVATMATNSKFILINPGFVMQLYNKCGKSDIGVSFVILHEVYHNLFKHFLREKTIFTQDPEHYNDHDQANVAQDYEINWCIEHSFLDRKSGEQIFGGVTTACEGLISPKFENMLWEDIYPLVSADEKTHNPKPKKNIIPLSDDYKNGYRDGWAKAIVELRAKGLIESVTTPKAILDFFMKLNEAVQTDYNAGFDAGYAAAYEAIMDLMQPLPPIPPGGGSGPGPTPVNPVNIPEKIDGLEPLKPIFEIDPRGGDGKSGPSNPNKPVDTDNTPRKIDPNYHGGDPNHNSDNDSDDNGKQKQGGGSGPGGNPGSNNGKTPGGDPGPGGDPVSNNGKTPGGDPGPGGDPVSNNGKTPGGNVLGEDPNGNPLDDIPNTVKVGTADGMFDGKEGMNASNDHLSDDEIEQIAKEAGYEEPDDENYAGRTDPFEDSERVLGTVKALAGQGQPGNIFEKIAERIKNILTPLIDWREELRKMLKGFFVKMQDAGWNKKNIARGNYTRIREREGETAKRLIFMVDTSGSVVDSGQYLEQITSEIAEIAHKVGARYIDLCQFSTSVYKKTSFTYYEFPPSEDFTIDIPGSGGTYYQPCFDYIEDNYIDEGKGFQAVIFFTDTDLCARDLPSENDFSWSNKIIWFLLNDSKESHPVEVPYGKMIEVSQSEFNNSLKNVNNMKTNESIKIPRRNIGKPYRHSLNEWVDTEEDEIQDIIDNGVRNEETGRIEISSEITPEEARKNAIDSLKIAGRLDEYKDKILNWIKEQVSAKNLYITNIGNSEISSYRIGSEVFVDDDLLITGDCNFTFHGQLLLNMMKANEIFGKFIIENNKMKYVSTWPEYIAFGKVRSLRVVSSYLDAFPAIGMPQEVSGTVRYDGLRNLKSLIGGPKKVGGNFIITRCPSLESLEGAPLEFDGYFMIDNEKFTNDEFYAMTANESYISNKSFNKLVDMRINSATNYKLNRINEAFSQRVITDPVTKKEVIEPSQLSRIFGKRVPTKIYSTNPNTGARLRDKNGNLMFKYGRHTDTGGQEKIDYEYVNKDALEAIKNIPIFWDQIPDEIVRNVRQFDSNGKRVTKNNADNQSAARRNVNGDYTEYGINIYCDKNDKIYIISTGNNKNKYNYVDSRGKQREGTWGNGNSWLWFAPGFFDLVNERINLIRTANDDFTANRYGPTCSLTPEEAAEECVRLGVPYSRNNVVGLGYIRSKSDFSENHMFAIPEYCCNSYIIKGTGDVDDASEFAKNFTFLSQRDKREFLSNDRLDANTGRYMTGRQLNPDDPAVNKYVNRFKVDASWIEEREGKFSVAKVLGTVKKMKESLINIGMTARKKILELINNEEYDTAVTDGYMKRFVNSDYRSTLTMINSCIAALEKYYTEGISNVNAKDMLDILNMYLNTNRGRYISSISMSWYDSYESCITIIANILGDIDCLRKGKPDEFAARGRNAF